MSEPRQDPVDLGGELAALLVRVPPRALVGWVATRKDGLELAAELQPRLGNPYEVARLAAGRLKWQGTPETLLGELLAAFPELQPELERLADRWGVALPVGGVVGHSPRAPTAVEQFRAKKAEELRLAHARRRAADKAGQDTAQVLLEIRRLEAELRSGPELHPGEFLRDGRYELERVLGRGSYATVWLAYDHEPGARVALKVLNGRWTSDESKRERFFRGARVMAELRHPNIVRVLEPELESGGFHFFAMEYVAGGDLHAAVKGGLEPRAALEAVLQAADALAFAWRQKSRHGEDFVHRDVKPHNILLDDGGAKLTDFDLIRDPDVLAGSSTIQGTAHYAAPEQLTRTGRVEARADVYGLGATALYCLVGDEGLNELFLDRARYFDQARGPEAVWRVLRRALAWKPGDRYAHAGELGDALRGALVGWEGAARPGRREGGMTWPASASAWTALVGILGLGVFVLLLVLYVSMW